MNNEILLDDLNCILINCADTVEFEVELNEERKMMSSDEIFQKVNFKEIDIIEVILEDSTYIRFADGEELVIFHYDYLDMLEVA